MSPIPDKKSKPSKSTPTLLRGFKDLLPEESPLWERARTLAFEMLAAYGFSQIDTALLEATSLFRRTIGEGTDIVDKEMFTFTDRSRDSVTLRPEFTAGIGRAYIEHGWFNRPQPVKLYAFGPVFRYDRPQAGRFRQFHQLDFEIIGSAKEAADAEVIWLAHLFCRTLGLEATVQVNSLGNPEARREYVKILKDYYRNRRRNLCEDCKKRLLKNPLRLLDCKEPACQSLLPEAPQLVDHLDDESKRHFVKVLEYLDEAEVPYVLNPYIVRGLDYYNRTAFEIIPPPPLASGGDAPAPAIGGGGRYDYLISELGGREAPAVGVAFGWERVLEAVKKVNPDFVPPEPTEVFLAQLGEEAAKHALPLFEKLRANGFKVAANFAKEGLKGQLETADKLGVIFAVILGQKELLDGTVIIRDMENGIQEVVDLNKVCEELGKRLKKKKES